MHCACHLPPIPPPLNLGCAHRFTYIQARLNVPNSTPQFEVAGTMEYIDGHDAGFYFIGYRECRVPCKLAFIQSNMQPRFDGGRQSGASTSYFQIGCYQTFICYPKCILENLCLFRYILFQTACY